MHRSISDWNLELPQKSIYKLMLERHTVLWRSMEIGSAKESYRRQAFIHIV